MNNGTEAPSVLRKSSPTIGKLAAALAKAQAAIKPAAKDSKNPFFNSSYADLASVWDAIREPLSANGLSVMQTPLPTDGKKIKLRTILAHESGEYVASTLVMCPGRWESGRDANGNKANVLIDDPTPQGVGSCLTYARRYALAAIVGVCSDDDDGNAANGRSGKPAEPPSEIKPPSRAPKVTPPPAPAAAAADPAAPPAEAPATRKPADTAELRKLIEDHAIPEETQAKWLTHFNVKSLDELNQPAVNAIVKKIKAELKLS